MLPLANSDGNNYLIIGCQRPCFLIAAQYTTLYACVEEPLQQLRAPDAERILEVLARHVGLSHVVSKGLVKVLEYQFHCRILQCSHRQPKTSIGHRPSPSINAWAEGRALEGGLESPWPATHPCVRR